MSALLQIACNFTCSISNKWWVIVLSFLWSCQSPQMLSYEVSTSKTYSWQRLNFHPIINISDRNDTSVTYHFILPQSDFMTFNETELLVGVSSLINGQWKNYQKKFLVPGTSKTENGQFSGSITVPVDSLCTEAKMHFKEVNTIRQEEIPLHFTPVPQGPQWSKGLHQQMVSADEKVGFIGVKHLDWAPRSEKLPSPPFSNNAPFIPNEKIPLHPDSLSQEPNCCQFNGSYIIQIQKQKQFLHVYKTNADSKFPFIVNQSDLVGPIRYLCSKDEFEKIQRSNEGAENQLEKFWLTSAGEREKAKDLIRLYYQRVEDANIHFTSYADGWKTDRGMIYLVFGHPIQIIEDDDQLTWYYGANNDPNTLKFVFKKEQHSIWGMIYILQRKEEYRNAWEYQVTSWRQGKIFD